RFAAPQIRTAEISGRGGHRLLVFSSHLVAAVGAPLLHQTAQIRRRPATGDDVGHAVTEALAGDQPLATVAFRVEPDRRILDADGLVLLEHADDVGDVVAALRIEIRGRWVDDAVEHLAHIFGAARVVEDRRADLVAGEVATLQAVGDDLALLRAKRRREKV